jgi:hypothetical protein
VSKLPRAWHLMRSRMHAPRYFMMLLCGAMMRLAEPGWHVNCEDTILDVLAIRDGLPKFTVAFDSPCVAGTC